MPEPTGNECLADFTRALFGEHLQEVSCLLDQLGAFAKDGELAWRDARRAEERLAGRLLALRWGAAEALDICAGGIAKVDAGELYGSVRLFCQSSRLDLVARVIAERCASDEEASAATLEALVAEPSGPWLKEVLKSIAASDPKVWPLGALLIGRQMLPVKKWLLELAPGKDEAAAAAMWALGRLRAQEALPLLSERLERGGPAVAAAAATALLELGDRRALDYCVKAAPQASWAWMTLGLAGGLAAARALNALAARPGFAADAERLLGLGLLGSPTSVPLLLAHLANKKLAADAALALWLITGAPLQEEAEAEVQEDELFPEELAKLKEGKPLAPPAGMPALAPATRLSRQPAPWQAFWAANASRFDPQLRYRGGAPCTPRSLIDLLEATHCPRRLRQAAYDELSLRYGFKVTVDAASPVGQQELALVELRQQPEAAGGRFVAGQWYLAASPVPA
jgi:hypothetical protein